MANPVGRQVCSASGGELSLRHVGQASEEDRRAGGPTSGLVRCVRYLPAALASVPLAYLVTMIARYSVDVPFWDQWQFVRFLQWLYEGRLSLAHLWRQHNEHRVFFPRIILLLLARVSGWSISYELAANVLLGVGIFAVLLWQVRASRRLLGDRGPNWLLPAISLMVFSLGQWENWVWGWEICIFLSVLAVVAGITVLATAGSKWWRLPAASFLGVVASYSFASGLVYWPAALPVLLACPARSWRSKTRETLAWLLCAVATIALYLYHYHAPASRPRPSLALAHPVQLAKYILVYLGSPVSTDHALRAGGLGLAALLVVVVSLRRSLGPSGAQLSLPYLSYCLYALLSAAMTGMGRLGFGVTQALSSRYVTMGNLLWISIITLLYLLAKSQVSHATDRRPPGGLRRLGSAVPGAALILTVLLSLRVSLGALPSMAADHSRRAAALAELVSATDGSVPRAIYPYPEQRRTEVSVLKRYHLSVFRQHRS